MTAVLELACAVLDDTRGWGDRAACIGKAATLEGPDTAAAKALCAACPVINDCRNWVMPLRGKTDPGGVRAGLTENERAALRVANPGQWRIAIPGGRNASTSPEALDQRRDTYREHRQQGHGVLATAKTMGIGIRTARRYEAQLKEEVA